MLDFDDTIVAIASPTVPAIRGIVRLSGTDVPAILNKVGLQLDSQSAHALDAPIDVGAPLGSVETRVMVWPTVRSYTGQPSAEIHTFGSLPVLEAIVDQVVACGARAARPGEFTMRAFLAGRLDLTQAEAVLGVIDAEQRGSLDHALRQLAGNLSRPLEQMRSTMLDLLADVEAGLDFVDEDIEFISDVALVERLSVISEQLKATQKLLQQRGGNQGNVVITVRGEPNAGKSQLVNALADREVAIVADVAGTTRDVVTVDTQFNDCPVTLIDTAGIEHAREDSPLAEISRQSQSHAQRATADADIRLWCVDSSRNDFAQACTRLQSAAQDHRQSAQDIWVATKADQLSSPDVPHDWTSTSSVTGEGIDALRQTIIRFIQSRDSQEVGSVIGTAARCRGTLQSAITAVDQAIRLTTTSQGHEFVSAELRTAVGCLGEVTGAVYTDDILDRVFGRFCIGK